MQPAEDGATDAEILRNTVEQDVVVDRIERGWDVQGQKNCRKTSLCGNGCLGASGQKSDTAIRSGNIDFYKTDAFPLP